MSNAAKDAEANAPGAQTVDFGLAALALIAGYYRIAADPAQLRHQLALTGRAAEAEDLRPGGQSSGAEVAHRARRDGASGSARFPIRRSSSSKDGGFVVLAAASEKGKVRLVDPIARTAREVSLEEAAALSSGAAILVTRRLGGAGVDPNTFGFRWFWPSILRYRRPLAHVLVASLFVQLFALATPIFFQLVVDKVLVHKGMSTLVVLVVGMVTLGLFETVLQFLRSYTLSHTTNRIDVELGRRLFHHLFRLPLAYFETRAAGQTVARMRELETIRSFLTGQGLTALIDLVFTLVFIGVMFIYSVEADAGRADLDPGLRADRGAPSPDPARADQREVQPRRALAAVPGRIDRRRADAEGRERRADDAGAVGGAARVLRAASRSTPASPARSART